MTSPLDVGLEMRLVGHVVPTDSPQSPGRMELGYRGRGAPITNSPVLSWTGFRFRVFPVLILWWSVVYLDCLLYKDRRFFRCGSPPPGREQTLEAREQVLLLLFVNVIVVIFA